MADRGNKNDKPERQEAASASQGTTTTAQDQGEKHNPHMPSEVPVTKAERRAFFRARRGRNIALLLLLLGFCALVFLITLTRLGGNVAERAL